MEAVRPIKWEETACPLCAGRGSVPLVEAGDPLAGAETSLRFQVVRCRDCSLSYTNPRPDAQSIGRFYPDDYAPYTYRDSAHRARWWPKRDSFARVLPLPPGGRLLDFGCGAGDLLQDMRGHGWQVTGLDFSSRVVRHIREGLGLPAVEGTLPHPDLPAGSFEAVTMSQSLEHVHDPLGVLHAAHRLLTPGGKVAIAVPNIDSLPFHWFGPDWYGLDVPRHLTHFTPRTLGQMLQAAGFRIGALHLIRHNSWLRRSASLAARHPERQTLWRRLLRFRMAASFAGWYSAVRRQANCILAVGVRAA
jgi:SAM-dependent methyltransferase